MKTISCVRAMILGAAALAATTGCSSQSAGDAPADELHARIGAQGGELTGAAGTSLAGVHVVIPAGALTADTDITVRLAHDATPLPPAALACGPTIEIEPAGLALAQPAQVTLPFDETIIGDHQRFDDEVKIWARDGDHWSQKLQTDSSQGLVTFDLPTLTNVAAGVNPPKDQDIVRFELHPNPKFLKCIAQYPDDPNRAPRADVLVVRGEQNDALFLHASNLKPGVNFDMFTVQSSSLKSDGTPDPAFTNFGMAWYQSDVDTRQSGTANVVIRTILLDQIFGFDPRATLPPTGTFHIGIWFNDPKDAAPCGFDVTKPTPFNGDHTAGPVAMISVPNAQTDLGPLCTKPDTSVTPARCSP
jgi:hypothetical protein